MESGCPGAQVGRRFGSTLADVADISKAGTDGPSEAIGLVYGEIEDDRVTASVPITPVVQQPFGLVHGGVYSLIAESICSSATALAVAPEGCIAMGQSNSATFFRPLTEGTIHATGTRRHGGRTTWVWDVDMTDDDDRLCAAVRMVVAVRSAPNGTS